MVIFQYEKNGIDAYRIDINPEYVHFTFINITTKRDILDGNKSI